MEVKLLEDYYISAVLLRVLVKLGSFLGMGTTYSMPHTPEDFLANMDDNMDVGSESHTMDTPDISTLSDNIDSTDDLVPTLQLGEEFPILDDVQSLINPPTTKPDNVLIWL